MGNDAITGGCPDRDFFDIVAPRSWGRQSLVVGEIGRSIQVALNPGNAELAPVGPRQVVGVIMVALVLIGVTLAASLLPAWRAGDADPMKTLNEG